MFPSLAVLEHIEAAGKGILHGVTFADLVALARKGEEIVGDLKSLAHHGDAPATDPAVVQAKPAKTKKPAKRKSRR